MLCFFCRHQRRRRLPYSLSLQSVQGRTPAAREKQGSFSRDARGVWGASPPHSRVHAQQIIRIPATGYSAALAAADALRTLSLAYSLALFSLLGVRLCCGAPLNSFSRLRRGCVRLRRTTYLSWIPLRKECSALASCSAELPAIPGDNPRLRRK